MKSRRQWAIVTGIICIASPAWSQSETPTPKSETQPAASEAQPTDETKAGGEAKESAGEKASESKPSDVVVTVNGHAITAGEVSDLFETVFARQTGGQQVPENIKNQYRQKAEPNLIETLIDDYLLTESAKKEGIKVTPDQLRAEMQRDIDAYLLRTGLSKSEFEDRLKRGGHESLAAFIDERVKQPEYERNVLHIRLLEKKYADKLTPTDEEIKGRYDRDKERLYSQPEKVRASHILIKSSAGDDEEKKADAKKRADAVLTKAKETGADFAALAREQSEGPSADSGGDLGFFPRKGVMVEPFAAAAFDLKTGDVSDIVETQFGYHVIRVTDRREAKVVTLEEAKPAIVRELRAEKISKLRGELVAELRSAAQIKYAKDKGEES